MAVVKLVRGVNAGESYVTSPKRIKDRLSDINIPVYFGLQRQYMKYDFAHSRHASNAKGRKLSGDIVAAISFNTWEGTWTSAGMLLLYPVKTQLITAKVIKDFNTTGLDTILRWYTKQQSDHFFRNGGKELVISIQDEHFVFTEIE